MDQPNSIPTPPSNAAERLADEHIVANKAKFGVDRALHLEKVKMALSQYLITRTLNIDEGIACCEQITAALRLAHKELNTNPAEHADPTSN